MKKFVLNSEFENPINFFKDIVGREENVVVSEGDIHNYYQDKTIMIVGAGGTIGSSVARKLILSGVKNVYFLDRDESALHALALSISDNAASHSDKCIVADIKDLTGIKLIFKKYKPDLVLHAAALKHLVILEKFQREGFITNVIGTYNLLLAAKEYNVKQFINVSTDKAANPTSFLGKTKKITELITEIFDDEDSMRTCSVRFGNVFASRGSVIETFIHQIENDIPVTLTDFLVTRYFMSHDEAANLILAAGIMSTNGVLVQNMGSEVLLSEIIKNLSHYVNKEYRINIIGLQTGEKLREELYADSFTNTRIDEIVKIDIKKHAKLLTRLSSFVNPDSDEQALIYTESLLGD
jgi:FlaA1/EpsC-like NDP-sugar epimerase